MNAGDITPTCSIAVEVYDGARELFPAETNVLYRLFNGAHREITTVTKPPQVRFTDLTFSDNLDDNYSVVVSVPSFGTTGYFPVRLSPRAVPTVRLILLSAKPKFDFTNASWDRLRQNARRAWDALNGTALGAAGNPIAQEAYEGLGKASEKSVACLLNILTAMDQIQLGGNETPLDFVKDIRWDMPPQQDRFYCWADQSLIEAIRESGRLFAQEPKPSLFHGGTATRSWKEAEYSEANVQFTFHEGITHPSNPKWVQLEPDIDYFKDPAAHFFGEVFVNWFGSITEPTQVYQLRFIDGNQPGRIPFAPPYVIR